HVSANALNVTGVTLVKGKLDGRSTVNANALNVTGATTIGGETQLEDTLSVTGVTVLKDILDARSVVSANALNVTGVTLVKGKLDGRSTVNANALNVTGATTIGGETQLEDTLSVTGETVLKDILDAKSVVSANALNVTGVTLVKGKLDGRSTVNANALNVTGATIIGGETQLENTLSVTGVTVLKDLLDARSVVSANALNVTGVTLVKGKLDGRSTVNANALNVTGATTIGGETQLEDTLSVTGVTVLKDILDARSVVSANALNVTGVALVKGKLDGRSTVNANALNVTGVATIDGDTSIGGNTTIGDSIVDTITINSTLQGATPLFFEGATSDGFQTTIIVADPTEPHNITIPNLSGTILLSGSESSMSTLIVTGPSYLNEVYAYTSTIYGDMNMLTSTFRSEAAYITNAIIKDLIVNGPSTMRVSSPTYITGTIQFMTTTGKFQVSGPNGMEVSATTGESLHVTGTTGLSGALIITGTTSGAAVSVSGSTQIQSNNPLIFEGADSTDGNNTTIALAEPSSAQRITIPNASGTIQLKNFSVISSSRTLTTNDQGVVLIGSATASDITINLPTPVGNPGLTYTIKKTNSSNYSVAIQGYTIDGVTYSDMHMQYAYLEIVSDGSNWYKIAEYPISDEAPVPGNSGTIDTSSSDSTSITIYWTAATDSWSNQEDLQYLVCCSTSYSNVNDFSLCEANAFANYSTYSPTQLNITGLTSGTTYYYNIIVKDEGDHKAMYSRGSETPNDVIIYNAGTSSGSMGGRTGADAICAASANRPITGFTNYHALISFSASDTIANMPTTFSTLKQTTPIKSNAGTITSTIASNWADLMNGIERQALVGSAAMPVDVLWWAGTLQSDGSYYDSCSGFSTTSGTGITKYTGYFTDDTADWMKNDQYSPCSNSYYIMCIAW
ncbi:hypothetical protein MHK_004814, partial [Candidatus Magnetomorum sp. HK-1]